MHEDSPASDWRLVAPAATAWLGAWCATEWPAVAGWLAGAFAALTLGFLRVARRRAWFAAAALAAVAGTLTAGLTAVQQPHRLPESLTAAAEEGALTEFTAVTTTIAREGARGDFYHATLSSHHDARALLFAPPELLEQPIGTALNFEATVTLAEPGSEVVALLFVGEAEVVAEPHPLLQLSNGVRAGFVELARDLPNPGAMLVPGLAVGDESLVDDALDEAMKVSSLTHLTAVSGSNIAIVVAGLIALGRALGWSRILRCAVAAVGLAGFVLLVTPQGSVIRASAMAFIVLALDTTARPAAGVPVLSLAILGLLAADPWLSHNYGFALSAAATAGLLLGTSALARFFGRWLPPPIALLLAVPVVAQAACQPVLILLEPSIPLYGIVANLLAAPAAPIATVVGLLACLVVLVLPPLGLLLAWVAWLPAQWIALIAQSAERLPAARVPWLSGWLGALAWLALCLAVVMVARRGTARWQRVRVWTAAALTVVLITGLVWSVGRLTLRLRDLPADWRLVACDVGQGDALLLRAGEATVLVDTGEDASALRRCLTEFGIERIEVLLLSHFDRDHAGAATDLAVPVREVWLPDSEQARTESLTARLQAGGVPVRFVAAGDEFVLGDLVISALSPTRGDDGSPATSSGNDGSLAVRAAPSEHCVSSCFSTLFLGDLGEHAQAALDSAQLDVDVVKMSHHGSADQSAELYQRAAAELAIVSVGAENGYGHPTAHALELLAAAGTPWLRTDESGAIAVFSNGNDLAAWTAN